MISAHCARINEQTGSSRKRVEVAFWLRVYDNVCTRNVCTYTLLWPVAHRYPNSAMYTSVFLEIINFAESARECEMINRIVLFSINFRALSRFHRCIKLRRTLFCLRTSYERGEEGKEECHTSTHFKYSNSKVRACYPSTNLFRRARQTYVLEVCDTIRSYVVDTSWIIQATYPACIKRRKSAKSTSFPKLQSSRTCRCFICTREEQSTSAAYSL